MKNPCEVCIVKSMCKNDCKEFSEYISQFKIKSLRDMQTMDTRHRTQLFIKWCLAHTAVKTHEQEF